MQVNANSVNIHQYCTNIIWQNHSSSVLPGSLARQSNNGSALSATMRAKLREVTDVARKNIKLLQNTDSHLAAAGNYLNQMKELATKSTSETLTASDRQVLQKEINLIRSEIDRNAYEANGQIREKLGLPPVGGHFELIANGQTEVITNDNNEEAFKKGKFVYDQASDEGFENYVGEAYILAKKHRSMLEYATADTIKEIWNALQVMRPANLGVDQLDITTVDKAKASIENIDAAQGMVTQERSLIQNETKKWFTCLKNYTGKAYLPSDITSQTSFELTIDLDVTA